MAEGAGGSSGGGGESFNPRRQTPSADPWATEGGRSVQPPRRYTAESRAASLAPPRLGSPRRAPCRQRAGRGGGAGAPHGARGAPPDAGSRVTCLGPRPGVQQSDLRPPVAARPAPHHLPQEQPHAPSGRASRAAGRPEQQEPGLHGARFPPATAWGSGRACPEQQRGPLRQRDRKLTAPSPPETPSPGAAGSAGSARASRAGKPPGRWEGRRSRARSLARDCGPSPPAPRLALTRGLASPGLPPTPRDPVGAPERKECGGLGHCMV